MFRKLTIQICILWSVLQLNAYNIGYAIEIQKPGKTDICSIGTIDDGDTFDLNCRGWYYSDVRLIGVNTPDYNSNTEKWNCYYNEAKKYISERKKKTYEVTFYGNDLCKDPYKWCRNLVQLIDIKNRIDIGQMMILRWFAFSWTNFSMIPNNMRNTYNTMESISSSNHLWLWSQCHIISTKVSWIDSSIPTKMTSSPRITKVGI